MPRLRIFLPGGREYPPIGLIPATEQNGQADWYRSNLAKIRSLLPPDIVAELDKRGLCVVERDSGPLLGRLNGALRKGQQLSFRVEG